MARLSRFRGAVCALALLAVLARPAAAADEGSVGGTVFDPLGAVVSGAQVFLVQDGRDVKQTTTDSRGEFAFMAVASGRYQVHVTAGGFTSRTSDPVFVGATGRSVVDVVLDDWTAPAGRRGHGRSDGGPGVADRRAGHGARRRHARHPRQARRARGAAPGARLAGGPGRRSRRGDVVLRARRRVQLQQGADRRRRGQRHRRRLRLLVARGHRRRIAWKCCASRTA